jgi:hypothetical protein
MAQAAPLAGLYCLMVAVPVPPRAAVRKLRLLSALKDGRPLKRRASVRARASTCSFDLRIGRICRCASRREVRAECQRARRIRAQQWTQMRVNARKSSYGISHPSHPFI